MRTVLTHPHPILDGVVPEVTDFSMAHLAPIVDEMTEVMEANHAIGLAANQIGINERIVCIRTRDESILFYYNPVIIGNYKTTTKAKEGCLSMPDVIVEVERYNTVQFTSYCLDEERLIKEQLAGRAARIFQHEVEHLFGLNIKSGLTLVEWTARVIQHKT